MRPVSAPWHCAAYSCTADMPSPQRGAGGTLKCFSRDYTGLRRDVRSAWAGFPVAVSPVRPSPSLSVLCGHPRHCSATPGTATTSPTLLERTGTGHRHACHYASYGLPLAAPSNRPAGGGRKANLYATTLEVDPVREQDAPRRPNRSEIRQDSHQLRGTTRHASTRRRVVRHACKLLPPWPIKGEVVPQPQDTRQRTAITRTPSVFATILALASINTSGTWRPGLLSCHACSPPLRAPQCNAI
jgi:hypothetical protein